MQLRPAILRTLPAALCLFSLAGCIGPSAFWAPDGRTIALDVEGKLRLFDLERERWSTLDTGGRYVVNPTFSPDGRFLAYYGITRRSADPAVPDWYEEPGSVDLWVRDLRTQRERRAAADLVSWPAEKDGTTARRLISDLGERSLKPCRLVWSPDSRRLAFLRGPEDRLSRLQVVDIRSGAVADLAPSNVEACSPAWSPDGRRLAYYRLGDEGRADLYVAEADGSDPLLRTGSTPEIALWVYQPPVWLPDGGSLLFLAGSARGLQAVDLRRASLSGTRVEPLGRLPTHFVSVAPDGRGIAYLGGKEHRHLVYRAAPFKEPRILDQFATNDGPLPVLSPDGRTIAAPLRNADLERDELRIYDVRSGRIKIYPVENGELVNERTAAARAAAPWTAPPLRTILGIAAALSALGIAFRVLLRALAQARRPV